MRIVQQRFHSAPAVDVPAAIEREWARGSTVAIGVGSRGNARLDVVVRAVVSRLKDAG